MSNTAKIRARISVLEAKLGKPGNTLGKDAGLGNGTVDKWTDKQLEKSNATIEKFLSHYRINQEWWETGSGEIFAIEGSKEKLKSPEEIYRDLVENNSDYRLVPKTILDEEYRIILKSEIDSKEKMLWEVIGAKNLLIAQLEKEITELRMRQGSVVHAKQA